MKAPRISVVCTGDPLQRSTWSGTPLRICEQLKILERLGPALDAEGGLPRPLMWVVRAFSRAIYLNSHESARGQLPRAVRGWNVRQKLCKAPDFPVLHIGTKHLPLKQPLIGQKHYLYCDATWHSWLKYSTSRHLYTSRLIQDAERMERQAYSQMNHIFSISEYVRADLLEHYGVAPGKVTVVGTGRGAIEPFFEEKDYSKGTVLFVAKERFRDKGGELLLQGFHIARERRPSLGLTIAGDPRYVELADQKRGVRALGYVSLAELQGLFNRASLFALPAYNEPWGLVYLEALSCRTPVLGFARNAFPELSGHGQYGFSVDQVSAEGVANALLKAFEEPKLLREMGLRGQEYSLKNFTWERTVERMVDVIDRS